MIRCLGEVDDTYKKDVIEQIIQRFAEKYPKLDVAAYIGYPVYIEEYSKRRICVDLALMTKRGIFIINILQNPVTDYVKIQDDIYMKVESKFKKQPMLIQKRKLCFDFFTITYSESFMERVEDYPLARSMNEFFDYIDEFMEKEEFVV